MGGLPYPSLIGNRTPRSKKINLSRPFLALFACLFWGARVPIYAAGPGTSAATFLDLGYGARPVGLSEAFVPIADDAAALHYNPAGLAYPGAFDMGRGRYEMLVAHSIHIQDIQMTQMGFVARPFGISLTHLNVGGIEQRTSETASSEGDFGAADTAIGLSAAQQFFGIGLGATVKYIRETIGPRAAQTYAADFGALRRFERIPLSLGLGISNLGKDIRFIDQSYPLPRTLRAGVAYGMTPKFPHALSLQLDFPRDSNPVLRLGVEYRGFGPFALRAGYRTYTGPQREAALGKALGTTASGISEFYGMFMGAGFISKFGNLDYAIVPYGELGTAHRFSFSLKFGSVEPGGRSR